MKILFWTSAFWPRIGGIETYGLALLQALQARGHQCVVITNKYLPKIPSYEIYQGIPVYRYEFDEALQQMQAKQIGSILRQIKKLIVDFSPDLIHLNIGFGRHLYYCSIIKKSCSLPIIITMHGLLGVQEAGPVEIYQALLGVAVKVNAVSFALLEELRNSAPQIIANSSCIYNAVPTPSIRPKTLAINPIKILCLGRLTYEKGYDLAITAFYTLRKRFSNVELIIAGDGNEKVKLETLVDELELSSCVQFVGRIEPAAVYELINSATMVVVPSRYEAFGLTAIEAAHMARPVIATRTGGLVEIVRHLETGLLVSREDSDALSDAMYILASNINMATLLGKQARVNVEHNFHIEATTNRYQQLYEETLRSREHFHEATIHC